MQIILTKEEYDALRQQTPKHLEMFNQMFKEWRGRMDDIFKARCHGGEPPDQVFRMFRPIIDDVKEATDSLIKHWTPEPKGEDL
jgi:hypothetical protein